MIYDASVNAIGFIHEVKNDMIVRLELVSKIRPDWQGRRIEQPIHLHHSGSLQVANLDKHNLRWVEKLLKLKGIRIIV